MPASAIEDREGRGSQRTNGDGMQHGFEVGHVVQQTGCKGVECRPVPQQLLCCLDVLLLQGGQVDEERLVLSRRFCHHFQQQVSHLHEILQVQISNGSTPWESLVVAAESGIGGALLLNERIWCDELCRKIEIEDVSESIFWEKDDSLICTLFLVGMQE